MARMSCGEFERLWQDLLDAPGSVAPELEEAMRAHAESCPACAALGGRFERLRRGLQALGQAPAASPETLDRVVAAVVAAHGGRPVRRPLSWTSAGRLAAAAAILGAVGLIGLRGDRPERRQAELPAPTPALAVALDQAASATLELARATSESAARLGREVLDGAAMAEWPVAEPVVPATDLWHALGDQISNGVEPLSGSARHAFSFLLDPALGSASPAPAPAPKANDGA